MKKLLSVFLAVCLAVVCGIGFVACDSIDAPTNKPEIGDNNNNNNNGGNTPDDDKKPDDNNGDKKPVYSDVYYAYDVETDEYEDADFIAISSTAAAWHGVDISLGDLDFDGSVRFDGNDFTITLNGKFSAQDACIMTYKGKREGADVLRVESTVITKYSTLIPQPSVTTDITVRYYCKKGSKPTEPPPEKPVVAKNYYLYNAQDKTYDENEYIKLDGDKLTVHAEGFDEEYRTVDVICDVEIKGNEFVATYTKEIKKLKDYMTDKAVSRYSSILGMALNEFEFDATLTVTCRGYIYDNAIRSSLELQTKGFIGTPFGMFNKVKTVHSYYGPPTFCPDGETPDYSVNVTFDMNGGTLNGRDKLIIRTESDGTINLPIGTPIGKEGMGFWGYVHPVGESTFTQEYTYSELTVLAKWTPLVKITYRIDSSEYAFEDESKSVISVVSGKPLGAEAFPKLTAKVDNPKTRFKGWYDENGKQINPDNFVSKDKTEVVYTAQWHPPLYVSIYNNDLKRDSKYYNGHFYIHFIPPYVADNSNGNYGGGSECIIMPVKNGKPDTTKRCALNAVYYDLAGKYYYMDIRQNRYLYYYDQNGKQQSVSFYGVDFCVEYIHTDGTARTYLVSASDLNVEVHNHIFIRDGSDEYTKAW